MPQLPKPKLKVNPITFNAPGASFAARPPLASQFQAAQVKPAKEDEVNELGLSEQEIKIRRRKFLSFAAGSYAVFVAGAYWYLTKGVATNETFEDAVPRDTTPIFDGLAEGYDDIVNRDELFMLLSLWRKGVTKQLKGDVLEVSCGTGRNINYLNLPQFDSITFTDTSSKMVDITKGKFQQKYPKFEFARFVACKAEELPADKKYDTIYETFGLCSHEDPIRVLHHLQTLLKPGGKIILLEHGRGTWDFINRILDKNAKARAEHFGCRWNLDIGEIVRQAGLAIESESRSHLGTTWTVVTHRKDDKAAEEAANRRPRFLIW
ncbi:S-adenosyl-L-methionine-dependent methyltransferase [Lipomyces japonicus]|uniref:S-adenosyl-L-methionine-dependent methyltransferase n=1 Tax=Lipomyces japonicus TaxID=56871 RepID=UPI0034CF2C70